MEYWNNMRLLLEKQKPKLVDPDAKRVAARMPTQASSQFVINRQQGDWAETILLAAINKIAKHHVAVRYGMSDDRVAGQVGFKEFFQAFQQELDAIGKRPDLLIFKKEDLPAGWGTDISRRSLEELDPVVKKAVVGLEVRSSAYLAKKYEEAVSQEKEPKIRKKAKRTYLSFTPKVEDLRLVYEWVKRYNVRHFYVQVFFDQVYALSYEHILTLLTDPANEKSRYFLEGDVKNQQKRTVKINLQEGALLAPTVDMPSHSSGEPKKLQRGRLLFYVTFKDGAAHLNPAALAELMRVTLNEL